MLVFVCSKAEVTNFFSTFGKMERCVVPTSDQNGGLTNKGFAFVTYENIESVRKVFDNLSIVKIRGKRVT